MVDSTTVQAYIHFLSWQPRPEDHLRAVWLAAEIHGLPTNGRIPTEARTHRANVFVPKHPSALKPDRSLPGLTAALNVLEDNNDAHAALQWVKCLAMRPSSRHSLRPKDWMLALKAARRQSVKGQGLVYGQSICLPSKRNHAEPDFVPDLKQLYEPWRAERQTLNHTDPSIKVPPSFYLLQEAFQPTPQTTPHYRLVVKQERKTANRAAYTAKRRQQRELRTESDRGQRQGRQTRTVDGSAQPRIMQQWLS